MCSKKIPESFYGLLLLILVAVCVVPVHGQDGTVSISYRGAMQHYIGDSVIFDGKNTVGNTTVITVTGPGLPSAGVPPSTLTGTAGTGDPVYMLVHCPGSEKAHTSSKIGAASISPRLGFV